MVEVCRDELFEVSLVVVDNASFIKIVESGLHNVFWKLVHYVVEKNHPGHYKVLMFFLFEGDKQVPERMVGDCARDCGDVLNVFGFDLLDKETV